MSNVRGTRSAKAALLRELRKMDNMTNKQAIHIATLMHDSPKKPRPDTIASLLGLHFKPYGIAVSKVCEYGESWTNTYLLDGVLSDEEVYHLLGVCEYYNGPGRGFARRPHVERSKYHTFVIHCGGLDI